MVQVAVRVNPVLAIGLMACIFWLPRPELLSWIRTVLEWDRFYGEPQKRSFEWILVAAAHVA